MALFSSLHLILVIFLEFLKELLIKIALILKIKVEKLMPWILTATDQRTLIIIFIL
jgi:hypothetical protein